MQRAAGLVGRSCGVVSFWILLERAITMVNTRSSRTNTSIATTSDGGGGGDDTVKNSNSNGLKRKRETAEKTDFPKPLLTRAEQQSLDDDSYYRYVASLGPIEIRRRIREAELLKEQLAYMRDQSILWSNDSERKPPKTTAMDDGQHPYKHLKWLLEARLEYVNLLLEEMEYEERENQSITSDHEDEEKNDIKQESKQIQIPDIDSTI